jgi:hypothetical protein
LAGTVTVVLGGNTLIFVIGAQTYRLNGRTMNITHGQTVVLNNNRVYAPVHYIVDGLNIRFGYDPDTVYGDNIRVFSRGREIRLDQPILNLNDRIMYPFRQIAEAVGAEVNWNGDTRTASAAMAGRSSAFVIGENDYTDNGVKKPMDAGVRSFIFDSRTYVPLRYIVEPLGYAVRWDGATSTITIE